MTENNSVSQIMIYSSEQDPILLRIGTAEKSEYQLWLLGALLRFYGVR
jgi:hypothetical protein